MKKFKMPDITTSLQGPLNKKIKIPGGWIINLPEATGFDETTIRAYSRYFQTQGMSPLEAQQEVMNKMNKIFHASWIRHSSMSVRYWARKYAKKYPKSIQKDGTLKGFKPELLQQSYIPAGNVGRKGKVFVNNLMVEMMKDEK